MTNRNFPRELAWPALLLLGILAFLLILGLQPQSASHSSSDAWAAYHPPSQRKIALKLNRAGIWALRMKRQQALRDGVLISEERDWVPGTLKEGDARWPVRLRLKGDWTDHLVGGKWSFRVKVRRDSAYRGMTVFSLQNPATRDYLSEWLFHQVLRREGVLSPRYDFVRLSLNGSDLGVYALEEHFTKQLVESQGRRAGVQLKFSEDGMWAARREALQDSLFPYLSLPLYEAAQPEAFQSNRYLRNDSLQAQLMAGLSLMHQYKHGLRPAGEVFDLDQVARQYALTDLFHGHHSLVWHNRRFVYNPITVRLEPVVYDAFAGEISGLYLNGPFTGYASNGNTSYGRREDLLGTSYFREPAFVRAYYRYLHLFSKPCFLAMIEDEQREEWERRERFLRREFLGYRYDFAALERHARAIREALGGLKKTDLTVVATADSLICAQNYAPVAVEVRLSDAPFAPWQLLGAYDGVGGAEWVEMPGSDPGKLEYRVAGSDAGFEF